MKASRGRRISALNIMVKLLYAIMQACGVPIQSRDA
jgi:hypothetical protein